MNEFTVDRYLTFCGQVDNKTKWIGDYSPRMQHLCQTVIHPISALVDLVVGTLFFGLSLVTFGSNAQLNHLARLFVVEGETHLIPTSHVIKVLSPNPEAFGDMDENNVNLIFAISERFFGNPGVEALKSENVLLRHVVTRLIVGIGVLPLIIVETIYVLAKGILSASLAVVSLGCFETLNRNSQINLPLSRLMMVAVLLLNPAADFDSLEERVVILR